MTNRIQKIEKAINSMSDDKFNELLNELGVKEEKRWIPEIGGIYCYVMTTGYVDESLWNNDSVDKHRLLMNNVFKTEEEAEAQSDFNIEKAKLIKEIEDSSEVIDWGDLGQEKICVNYDHEDGIINMRASRWLVIQGTTYTTNKEFLENLITNEPERVKKYLFGIGG